MYKFEVEVVQDPDSNTWDCLVRAGNRCLANTRGSVTRVEALTSAMHIFAQRVARDGDKVFP